MIFSTDDFWCLDMMKKNASRMRVLSVYDLAASETVIALRYLRKNALKFRYPAIPMDEIEVEDDGILKKVFDLVGGRMSHLTRVVRADDMLSELSHRLIAPARADLQRKRKLWSRVNGIGWKPRLA
jgi:hypothetical protein